jgi:FkbM family methyltransferase
MHLFETLRRVANGFGIDICRVGRQRLGRMLDVDMVALAPGKGIIFDVGANTGRAARGFTRVFPGWPIWSFEPGRDAFDALEAAADLHHVKKLKLALGDQDGVATLNVFRGSELNSLLRRDTNADNFIDPVSITPAGTEQVQTMRLDTFCEQQKLTRIAILKLDTQGYELPVLYGARRMLASGGIQLIQCEVTFAPL